MDFDANLQAITNDALLPKVVDTVLTSNPLTLRILGNAKKWSGEKLTRPIRVATAGNGGSFSGLDKFNTNTVNTKVKLSFDPRGYEQPVVIPGMEADVNAVSDRAAELVAEAIEEAADEMADGIGSVFYGDGTGNDSKDFLGLDAIIDDGGEVGTYGGQSRTTYTTIKANETDLGGALTLAAMASMYDSCKRGNDKPTLIVTTEAIWSDYEALLQPTVRHNSDPSMSYTQLSMKGKAMSSDALKGEIGFDTLMYRGVPMASDEKADSGKMWFINEKYLSFYRLPATRKGYTNIKLGGDNQIEGYYSEVSPNLGFDWSGLLTPIDQYAEIGHIILLGNLVSFNPGRHGVINTIS